LQLTNTSNLIAVRQQAFFHVWFPFPPPFFFILFLLVYFYILILIVVVMLVEMKYSPTVHDFVLTGLFASEPFTGYVASVVVGMKIYDTHKGHPEFMHTVMGVDRRQSNARRKKKSLGR
jgi:hypothetical protein